MPTNEELYGTSGIQWRQTAPKTFELRNIQPEEPPPQLGMADQEMVRQMFAENMAQQVEGKAGPAKLGQEAQRRAWRKQLKTFDQTLKQDFKAGDADQWRGDAAKKYSDDAVQGIQELIDSGAIWFDDQGGVYGQLENHPGGQKGTRRLLDAAREWGDWYRDQIAHGEDLPPQKHYEEMMKQQVMEDRIKVAR